MNGHLAAACIACDAELLPSLDLAAFRQAIGEATQVRVANGMPVRALDHHAVAVAAPVTLVDDLAVRCCIQGRFAAGAEIEAIVHVAGFRRRTVLSRCAEDAEAT